jgi:hypothetical protein
MMNVEARMCNQGGEARTVMQFRVRHTHNGKGHLRSEVNAWIPKAGDVADQSSD